MQEGIRTWGPNQNMGPKQFSTRPNEPLLYVIGATPEYDFAVVQPSATHPCTHGAKRKISSLAQYASTVSVVVLRHERPRRNARPRYALYVRATPLPTPLPTATALCIAGDAAIASSASSATALTRRRIDSSRSAETSERRRGASSGRE